MNKFSSSWSSSVQPRKQRLYKINAPLHLKHRMMSVHLSKQLRERYKRRNLPVRKGDTVKVLRGSFKNKSGVVDRVDLKKMIIHVADIAVTRKDGTKVAAPLQPSNLMILQLVAEDKLRMKKYGG